MSVSPSASSITRAPCRRPLLADEELGATSDEIVAEAKREPLRRKPAKERKPHPGRERLPKNLPRVETVIPCADPNCGQCGKETADIRYDISEQLDVEPARYLMWSRHDIWCE